MEQLDPRQHRHRQWPGNSVIYIVGNDIYAGSDFNGVYKSTDNGVTWNWMSNGLL
jgi:hypothetical protein